LGLGLEFGVTDTEPLPHFAEIFVGGKVNEIVAAASGGHGCDGSGDFVVALFAIAEAGGDAVMEQDLQCVRRKGRIQREDRVGRCAAE
jgi:hypothetical protein